MSYNLTRMEVLALPETAMLKPDEAAAYLGVARSTFDLLAIVPTEISPRVSRYMIRDIIKQLEERQRDAA